MANFTKMGEEILSNVSAQKNGLFKKAIDLLKPTETLEETAGKVLKNTRNSIGKSVSELSNDGKKAFKDNYKTISKTFGKNISELNGVEGATIASLAKSTDDVSSLTKDKIAEHIKDASSTIKNEARLKMAGDWFAEPVRTLRNSSDSAERVLAGKQMAARYGVAAAGAMAGAGVIHDVVSDDENDWGLMNVPIAGATGAGVGTAAYGISKLLKVK